MGIASYYGALRDHRNGYRLRLVVGVLYAIGGVAAALISLSPSGHSIGDALLIPAIISLAFAVAAIVSGFLVRRESWRGVVMGIIVGTVGLAFAAFDIASGLRVGARITTLGLPFVRLAPKCSIVRTLFRVEPFLRPSSDTTTR